MNREKDQHTRTKQKRGYGQNIYAPQFKQTNKNFPK